MRTGVKPVWVVAIGELAVLQLLYLSKFLK